MKKNLLIGLITFSVSLLTSIAQTDNCDKKALSENCKKKLEGFQYDSQKFSKINFGEKSQVLEVEVPVFLGEKYRIIFCTAGLPNPMNIAIYTKDKESTKREAIYTNKDVPSGTTEFVFDAPRVRKLFIDYNVPMVDSKEKLSGCVVFMVGYK